MLKLIRRLFQLLRPMTMKDIPRINYLFEGKFNYEPKNHSHCPHCHSDMDFLGCTDYRCRSKHSDVRFGM